MNRNTLLKSMLALVLMVLLPSMTTAATETITWIHTDHLGSPIAGRNDAGETTWEQAYAPWGEKQAVAGAPQAPAGVGYTGHVYDEQVGLIYAGARWYDPAMGRFISPDAVTFDGGGAGHFNRYLYAYNSPYFYSDPDGREPVTIVGAVTLIALHWERNRFNEPFDRRSFDMRDDISSTHQLGGQTENLKWLSKDGKSEYVTAGIDGEVVTDVMNMGTYNFVRAPRSDDSPEMKAITGFGHAVTDMVLWVPLGNRPTDISLQSNPITRVYGLGKAGVGKLFGGKKNEE